jgi:hypothetical protein
LSTSPARSASRVNAGRNSRWLDSVRQARAQGVTKAGLAGLCRSLPTLDVYAGYRQLSSRASGNRRAAGEKQTQRRKAPGLCARRPAPLASRQCIGYERQGGSRAIDVILHGGRPAHSDRPDDFAAHLNGEPSSPRCHTRKRGDAGQERRVALDEVDSTRGQALVPPSTVRFAPLM